RRAVGDGWIAADQLQRKAIVVVSTDSSAMTVSLPVAAPATQPAPESDEKKSDDSNASVSHFVWENSPETFRRRDVMFGHVFAFAGNPFPGSPSDWAWLLKS